MGSAIADVALAVKINTTIDDRFLSHGVGTEGIVIVNDQIGVFAGIDGTDAFIDAQLNRWIESDQFEGFVMREAAVLDALRRFLIEVRGFFGIVGIDGDDYAAAGHERGIVGDGVIGFHLVGPPV